MDLKATGYLEYLPLLALRTSCAARETEVPGSCAHAVSGRATASAHRPLLRAGTDYLLVDGYSGSWDGPFLLEVTATEALGLPPNDNCGAAQRLVFDASGRTKVSGDNSIAFADAMGLCGGGPDMVYWFTTTGAQRLEATLTPLAPGARQVLFLRRDCADAQTERACMEGPEDGPMTLTVGHLAPGSTCYPWVAGAPQGGAFELDVSLTAAPDPPPNNTCAGAYELKGFDPAPGGVVTVSDSNPYATDDLVGSCSTSSAPLNGPEVVYSFNVREPSSVSVTVSADNRILGLQPAFYVLDACPSPGYDLACRQALNGVAIWTFLEMAIVAVDRDQDGRADQLYAQTHDRRVYHVCQPHSEAPFVDVHVNWGTEATSTYGLACDAAANACGSTRTRRASWCASSSAGMQPRARLPLAAARGSIATRGMAAEAVVAGKGR